MSSKSAGSPRATAKTTRHGWAEVRVGKTSKWKRRWAVVDHCVLSIFESSSAMKAKLAVDLRFVQSLSEMTDPAGAWELTQHGKGAAVKMRCDDKSARTDWLALLASAVSHQAVSKELLQHRSDKLAMELMGLDLPPAAVGSKKGAGPGSAAAPSAAAPKTDRLAMAAARRGCGVGSAQDEAAPLSYGGLGGALLNHTVNSALSSQGATAATDVHSALQQALEQAEGDAAAAAAEAAIDEGDEGAEESEAEPASESDEASSAAATPQAPAPPPPGPEPSAGQKDPDPAREIEAEIEPSPHPGIVDDSMALSGAPDGGKGGGVPPGKGKSAVPPSAAEPSKATAPSKAATAEERFLRESVARLTALCEASVARAAPVTRQQMDAMSAELAAWRAADTKVATAEGEEESLGAALDACGVVLVSPRRTSQPASQPASQGGAAKEAKGKGEGAAEKTEKPAAAAAAAPEDPEVARRAEAQRVKAEAAERVEKMKREAAERRRLAEEAEELSSHSSSVVSPSSSNRSRKTSLSGQTMQLRGDI